MFRSFSTARMPLMLAGFLFIMLCAPELNAQSFVENAKKEGMLTLYSGLNNTESQFVGNVFTKKYPFIKFEFIRITSNTRISRLVMEKRAGKRVADVYQILGVDASIYRKEKLLQRYVSPEAKDWPKGFKDPEGYWTTYYSSYNAWIYNTRIVSQKEAPKSLEDLFEPKWKGNIGMGTDEYEWYQGMMAFMGREKGFQFMKRLAGQSPKIRNGKTLTMQLAAAGEFPIALGILHRLLQLRKAGAPIQWLNFPTPTFAGMRAMVLHADAPHPNAGKLFIDFMLSKEGQYTLNKFDRHPVRMDIEVDPAVEKARSNLFPIQPAPAEETAAYMKEFWKIFSIH